MAFKTVKFKVKSPAFSELEIDKATKSVYVFKNSDDTFKVKQTGRTNKTMDGSLITTINFGHDEKMIIVLDFNGKKYAKGILYTSANAGIMDLNFKEINSASDYKNCF